MPASRTWAKQRMLRNQLLVWLLVPLALLLSADAYISYRVALGFSREAYDRSLIEVAHEIALHVHVDRGKLELELPDAARRVLLNDPSDRIYFSIIAEGGLPIAGDALPGPNGIIAKGPRAEVLYDASMQGEPVRAVQMRIDANADNARPAALVRVAETEGKRKELTREILLSVIIPQVLLILIAGSIVWVGVSHGLSPLMRLQRAVASRSPHDHSPVAVSEVPGEVRPLLNSINGLLQRLDGALTLQSRFVADAAHQLKTPVAALQAQIELALRNDDPAQLRASTQILQAGLERLSRLVSQLLSLARNEPEGAALVRLEMLDLNAVTLEVASRWVPEALTRSIDLGFEGAGSPVMIEGDAGRLRELFDNLLDNAIRYSRAHGRVTVHVGAEPGPFMSVNDDGPSIPPQERQRVFERFHRLLGTSRDGSGLGLAIAQEIARIHGAEITLADDPDGVGNTFRVNFPQAGQGTL
ncbi:MAG: sensor histidine kinase N-terminal domain-containing protein [Burkholderiales bacterium]